MIKTTLIVIAAIITFSVPSAFADIYTPAEQKIILKFPTDNGDLNWDELVARVEADLPEGSSLNDYYLGAIVALRTGERELAAKLSNTATSTAKSDSDIAKAQLLTAFLTFYLSDASLREENKERLAASIEMQAVGDWLTGTSASVLVEHAYTASDPMLSKRVLSKLDELLSQQEDLDTQFWFINAYLKSAYASALLTQKPVPVEHTEFLENAIDYIGFAQSTTDDTNAIGDLKKLYYRAHSIDGVVASRRKTRGDTYDSKALPLLKPFHSDFQLNCIDELTTGHSQFRARKEYGTGGAVLLISVNEKGRGKFKSVLDAQPSRLMQKFMHRDYKTFAKRLRVTITADDHECASGGDIIIPFTIAW